MVLVAVGGAEQAVRAAKDEDAAKEDIRFESRQPHRQIDMEQPTAKSPM